MNKRYLKNLFNIFIFLILISCTNREFVYFKLPETESVLLSESVNSGDINKVSSALTTIKPGKRFAKHLGKFVTDAIALGYDDIAELLMDNGADVNSYFPDFSRPIFNKVLTFSRSSRSSLDNSMYPISNCIVNRVNNEMLRISKNKFYCKSPASMAIRHGNINMLKKLYDHGLSIEDLRLLGFYYNGIKFHYVDLTDIPCVHISLLQEAIQANMHETNMHDVIEFLLSKKLSYVGGLDLFGNSILVKAIEQNDQKLIDKLLQKEEFSTLVTVPSYTKPYSTMYRIHFANNSGLTALSTAIYFGNNEVAKKIINLTEVPDEIEYGATHHPNTENRSIKYVHPLVIASFLGNVEIINLLLDKNINPHVEGKLFLKNGQILRNPQSFRFSSDKLEYSITYYEYITTTREYLQYNNPVDYSVNYTPIEAAFKANKPDVVELLLNRMNANNLSDALILLIKNRSIVGLEFSILNKLLSRNIDLNFRDHKGYTALMHAVDKKSSIELVQLLLQHGADKNIKNNSNQTALDIAKEKSNNSYSEFCKAEYEKVINILEN
ncbi:ankyrin repeat domain-containing protein [Rickettsia endosymbiont of Cardiosporidium cionae]|uniref:ankyrin repeat domain-containing protein n=1 Tax=Rickettsia endosymbiont of Cardiosporidium cionae TaxID=2777155 RepID=UPI0018963AC6|nr:ankyrin repeat domain-containing protein [Rickettsia endosymbiont of Cardiosporidium cionae]KAF8818835.1 hypothetical protein IHI24_000069 [Rickettsia endosymbiont of Cardiosporidium cionae]